MEEKEAFLKTINDFSDHLYIEKSRDKRGYCFFYTGKKEKEENLNLFSLYFIFSLKEAIGTEISGPKKRKRTQFRGKLIKGWCEKCNKYIYQDC